MPVQALRRLGFAVFRLFAGHYDVSNNVPLKMLQCSMDGEGQIVVLDAAISE